MTLVLVGVLVGIVDPRACYVFWVGCTSTSLAGRESLGYFCYGKQRCEPCKPLGMSQEVSKRLVK